MVHQSISNFIIPLLLISHLNIAEATELSPGTKLRLSENWNKIVSSTLNMLVPKLYITKADTKDIIVDYYYVKEAISNPDVLIVDVREPEEIEELGKIPNSINIPVNDVATVLSTMSKEEFQHTYNRPKPSEDTEIIFYCMSGTRGGIAQQIAFDLGYKKAKLYLGGWTEWAEKEQYF